MRANAAPSRSPERVKLAEAIKRHRDCAERLAALQAAYSKAQQDCRVALDAIDAAETLLVEAKADEPRGYVERLLSGESDDNDLVATAQARLAEAQRQHKLASGGVDLLAAQITHAENQVRWAREDLREAIGAVLQSSTAAAQLVDDYYAAQARVVTLAACLVELQRIHGLPLRAKNWDASREYKPDPELITHWRNALAALEADADAALPAPSDRVITEVRRVIVDPINVPANAAAH